LSDVQSVTLVCESFPPVRTAGANRAKSLVDVLSERYQINVVYLINSNLDAKIDCKNINIRQFGIVKQEFSKCNFLLRVYFETVNAIRLVRAARYVGGDVVIVSIPFLMLLPVASLMLRTSRTKVFILEVRDLIWSYYEFKKGIVNGIINAVLSKICRWSIKRFDKVVTVTAGQKKIISEFYSGQISYVPNGLDYISYMSLTELASVKYAGDTIISYVGSIGFPQNLSVFIEAIKLLEDDGVKIKVNIVGDGPELATLKRKVYENNIQAITFMGNLSFSEVLKVYEDSHVLYAQLRDIPSLKTAEPTKIFEYIATSRRVIFGVKGDAVNLLKNFKGVDIIEPDNPFEIKDALKRSINCIDTSELSDNAGLLKAKYMRHNLIKEYLKLIEL